MARRDTIRALLRSACLVAIAASAAAPAAAQPTSAKPLLVTEAEAVRRALARPDLRAAIDGQADMARAAVVREGLWPNPQLNYQREQIYDNGGLGEDYAWLSQTFDLSGRRGLRSDAARHRARAQGARARARWAQIGAEVRLRFYEVVRLQEEVANLGDWIGRLEQAADTVARREAAGDASAYDRMRLERELAHASAQWAMRGAERARSWSRLAALIGDAGAPGAPWPRVTGTLLPPPTPGRDVVLERAKSRPEVVAMDDTAAAAKLEGEAAARGWVPQLNAGGGWKSIEVDGGRLHGFVAMGTLTLPIFQRHQDEAVAAEAERRMAEGERSLALAEIRGEVDGLWSEARLLHRSAQQFGDRRAELSAALVRAAEAGYRGGELDVLALLDAYRGAQQDHQQMLDLAFAARRARVELELLSGGYAL